MLNKGIRYEKLSITRRGYGNMRIMSRILPNSIPEGYNVTLVDRMPFHGLKPEFYALASRNEIRQRCAHALS